MADKQFIGLDNEIFRGRLRTYERRSIAYPQRPKAISDMRSDQTGTLQPTPKPQADTKPRFYVAPAGIQPPATQAIPKVQVISDMPEHKITEMPQQKATAKHSVSAILKPWRKSGSQDLKTKAMRLALPTMAGVLFLTGLVVSLSAVRTNHQITTTVHAQARDSEESSQDSLDESKPSSTAINSYKVAGDLPRLVTIDKISVMARVRRIGVNSKGQLQAPNNVHDVGWYDSSSKPGEPGAILLDSHVSGPTVPGAFFNIKKLVAGDVIKVERGDHKVFSYKVVKSQIFDKDKVDMASTLVSVVPGKAGLNIMTCTGKLIGKEYQQRLVVYAVQM